MARQTLGPRLHEDRNVRMVILELIPLLAEFCPERFFKEHLSAAMNVILSASRDAGLADSSEEETASFASLKGLALSLKELGSQGSLMRWIHDIAQKLMNTFERPNVQSHKEALECCGVLAMCLKAEWKCYAEKLLIPMVMTGISHALADCLKQASIRTCRVP